MTYIRITTICLALGVFFFNAQAHAFDWQSIFKKVGISKEASLADTPLGPGIKEILRVAVDRSTELIGQQGGYSENNQIQIKMPPKLKIVDKTLRKLGMGSQVDAFMMSMNRAAESAAPHARDIFIDAITEMNIEDANRIIKGAPTAATQYLDKTSRNKLKLAFEPIIQSSMSNNQVAAQYKSLVDRFKQNPLMSRLPMPRIEPYVVDKALDGLFKVIAQEEVKIRQNPAAQTTDLLKRVFAK